MGRLGFDAYHAMPQGHTWWVKSPMLSTLALMMPTCFSCRYGSSLHTQPASTAQEASAVRQQRTQAAGVSTAREQERCTAIDRRPQAAQAPHGSADTQAAPPAHAARLRSFSV